MWLWYCVSHVYIYIWRYFQLSGLRFQLPVSAVWQVCIDVTCTMANWRAASPVVGAGWELTFFITTHDTACMNLMEVPSWLLYLSRKNMVQYNICIVNHDSEFLFWLQFQIQYHFTKEVKTKILNFYQLQLQNSILWYIPYHGMRTMIYRILAVICTGLINTCLANN